MPDMEALMQAGTPGVAHRRLEPFEGRWKAVTRHWMTPESDPHEGTGVMTNSWALGNRFLRQDYVSDDGTFQGTGYWGYNNVTGRYEGFWIDCMSTGMMADFGTCNDAGDEWIMTGTTDEPGSGETLTKRTVITVRDADHHLMEMYFTRDGNEFKVMEIEYERA